VQRGELYVITGPLFNGTQLKRINRVLVPSHLLKRVLNGRRNEASAYLRANKDTDNYQRISVTELEQTAGISLLPGVTNKVKAAAMALPESHPYAGRRR
jgi:endonuclease G